MMKSRTGPPSVAGLALEQLAIAAVFAGHVSRLLGLVDLCSVVLITQGYGGRIGLIDFSRVGKDMTRKRQG
jgi:hypothetical protein